MPGLRPWPARWHTGRPRVQQFPLAAAQSFRAGDFLTMNGSGQAAEVSGADPTPLLGLAAEDAADVIETGYVNVYVFDDSWEFAIMSSGADPAAANKSVSYGILEGGDGVYNVDFTDVVNTRIRVNDVDIYRKLCFARVLAAHRQLDI